MRPKEFEYLIDAINSLPSIGTKAAEKIAYFLINQDEKYLCEFIHRIKQAKLKIKYCEQCNNFSYEKFCPICLNKERDNKKLLIVNNINELNKIEATGVFNGIYFVLNDEINVKTKKNINEEIIKKLVSLCKKKLFNEITIATNFTINGEATNIFIKKILSSILPNVSFYKLAIGLPINSALDYADATTLKVAIKNKIKV